MEDIECGKYEFIFASAENVLVKPFFSLMKKTATPFHQRMPVFIKLIIFECNFLLLLSIVYERKLSNRLTAAVLKDFRLENIECSKYHLFWTTQEVLSKPFLSWLKKYLPHCFTHQLYVCLFSVFNLTHFDWLPAHCLLSFTPEN